MCRAQRGGDVGRSRGGWRGVRPVFGRWCRRFPLRRRERGAARARVMETAGGRAPLRQEGMGAALLEVGGVMSAPDGTSGGVPTGAALLVWEGWRTVLAGLGVGGRWESTGWASP